MSLSSWLALNVSVPADVTSTTSPLPPQLVSRSGSRGTRVTRLLAREFSLFRGDRSQDGGYMGELASPGVGNLHPSGRRRGPGATQAASFAEGELGRGPWGSLKGRSRAEEEAHLPEVHLPGCRPGPAPRHVLPEMIGHYLGEFSITYKPVKHGRPGIGATHSSRFIPLK
uniref:40S ribosomal protein S15 n=1 Tax=Salvator merianae TaxID=96440 RepID=A0A8D0DS70_SALMN